MPGFSILGPNQAQGVPFTDPQGRAVGQLQILSAKTLQVWQRVFEVPDGGGFTGTQRAQALASTLNSIFADTTRDADFITPSYVFPADTATWPNGAYSVVWTILRSSDTCNTAFTGDTRIVPECLYAGCQFDGCVPPTYPKASKATWQNDLAYIRPEDLAYYNDVGWDLALFMANQIRMAIDAIDDRNRSLMLLNTTNLHNYTDVPQTMNCNFYLTGEGVVAEWTACFGGAETAHTADLTFATASPTLDCNMWIRVTLPSGLSVVGRATDDAPTGIEGTSGGIGNALQIATGCSTLGVTVGPPSP